MPESAAKLALVTSLLTRTPTVPKIGHYDHRRQLTVDETGRPVVEKPESVAYLKTKSGGGHED